MELMEHQKAAMEAVSGKNRIAYYHDMGLGKTFTGAETMMLFGSDVNIVICQKSKVNDWVKHFEDHYDGRCKVMDMTGHHGVEYFQDMVWEREFPLVGVINYDLVFRRPRLQSLKVGTLMLDESSLVQNEQAKRSKFIMRMKYENLILLSGTPTAGKYENLWSQMKMLGWDISKTMYWNQFVKTRTIMNQGFPIKVVTGYKNVERLKRKMREYGCHFLKTEEVIDLPDQNDVIVECSPHEKYKDFLKNRIVEVEERELVGDMPLTAMMYARQLCGVYSKDKLGAFRDLLESTSDRLLVFYNFKEEARRMIRIANDCNKPWCVIDGREKNLAVYENYEDSVTFIQYQAGAMGLNLQLSNKAVYFTPPLSSELFEQSKKRIHRIGQTRPCFYYYLTCEKSVEEKVYETLAMRKDYTDALFEEVMR